MKWFGIVALLFMLFVLAGVVYLGANSTKLGLDWGEPSAISKGHIPPTVPSFELKMPSFSTGFSSQDKIDLDKFERELKQAISEARSPQEIDQIIDQYATELFESNEFQNACIEAADRFIDLQNRIEKFGGDQTEMTNFMYDNQSEIERTVKEVMFCGIGFQTGVFDINDPKWETVRIATGN